VGMGFAKHGLATTLVLYFLGAVLVNILPAFANSVIAFIAPVQQRGGLLALHIGLMTSAGVLSPHLVGAAIGARAGDIAGGFEQAMGIFGIALVVASLSGLALIRPERTLASLRIRPDAV
jgi:energy-converting hydrogenase Eha subunit B